MARTPQAYSTASQAPGLQQVWQAMRIMRARFTTGDLLTTAQTSESAVHKYCRGLARAGFLRLVQARVSGRPGSRDVWALVRDTGPTAPIRRKDNSAVYDPNTGVVWGMDGKPVTSAEAADAVARSAAPRNLAAMHEAAEQVGHE